MKYNKKLIVEELEVAKYYLLRNTYRVLTVPCFHNMATHFWMDHGGTRYPTLHKSNLNTDVLSPCEEDWLKSQKIISD